MPQSTAVFNILNEMSGQFMVGAGAVATIRPLNDQHNISDAMSDADR